MNFWKASTFALTAALGCTIAYQNIPAARAAIAGRQPHMEAALQHLKDASNELKSADDDKGGFRAKAIANTNQAIDQTQKGVEWANTH
ncbi:MAG TPA: hypothetical protein VF407_25490 [Polyangiaceae bacterium]